jgi:hypothetical protein
MKPSLKLFATITKVDQNDDGTIEVHGIASTETKDSDGETVTKGAMKDAIPDYLMHGGTGPLRAMHQPIAAGYVYKAEVNTDGDTEISAKVVDPVEVLKVTTGVYKGFSIGGKKVAGGYDAATKTISKLKLTEISLVDRPANPEATITMWKGEDMDAPKVEGSEEPGKEIKVEVNKDAIASVDALAETINKGEITPQRILELIAEDIAKSAAAKLAAAPIVQDVSAEPKADEVVVKKAEDPDGTVALPDALPEADIKKGMYSVSSFCDVLRNIQYLASDAFYESKCEGDASVVPKQLQDWLRTGAAIFTAMATEEVNELVAALDELAGANEVILMAEKTDGIRKALTAEGLEIEEFVNVAKGYMEYPEICKALFASEGNIDETKAKLVDVIIAKVGARNNKTDAKNIQGIHDNSVALGAACELKKANGALDDIQKVCAPLGLAEGQSTVEFITKIATERDTLQKRVTELEAKPVAPKATLVVVAKKDDVIVHDATKDDEPIKKADGSIDGEATATQMIKKIHQSVGMPMARR